MNFFLQQIIDIMRQIANTAYLRMVLYYENTRAG
jgi:hypothetical protein